MVDAVYTDFVVAAGNASFWATECAGDFTHDVYNACRQPTGLDAAPVRTVRAGLNRELFLRGDVAMWRSSLLRACVMGRCVPASAWQ